MKNTVVCRKPFLQTIFLFSPCIGLFSLTECITFPSE